MLALLTPIIRRGIIDNTRRGVVELQLWFTRMDDPLVLRLEGDCLQDIAGCRVRFELLRPEPPLGQSAPLFKLAAELAAHPEHIRMGDITLSRRARSQRYRGQEANMLSIELFAEVRTRLLIESEEVRFDISLPEWECGMAHAAMQSMLNMSLLHDHVLLNVDNYRGPALSLREDNMPTCRWDTILNRAEGFMTILPSICEKYDPTPRGLLSEYFVMDLPEFLGHIADEEEEYGAFIPAKKEYIWDILHFIPREHTERVADAMEHPLFRATAVFSALIQKHVINDMEHYRKNREVEDMITRLAGTISQVLSTILAAGDDEQSPSGTARTRATVLISRLEKMRANRGILRPKAAAKFQKGIDSVLDELREFVCTLRP